MDTKVLAPKNDPTLKAVQGLFPDAGVRKVLAKEPHCITAWALPTSSEGHAENEGDEGDEEGDGFLLYLLTPFADSEARDRCGQIVVKIRALDSECLAPIVDVGEREGHPFLCFQRPPGRTLEELLGESEGLLEPQDALDQAKAITLALEPLHEAGLYHGGLHPGNILIRPDGRVCLLAPALEMLFDQPAEARASRLALVQGSLRACLAPEQTDPYRSPGLQTDFFAIGSILYSSLAGSDRSGLFKLVSKEANLSQSVDDIITSCLQSDPSLRPATAKALSADLAAVSAGNVPKQVSTTSGTDDSFEDLLESKRREKMQSSDGLSMWKLSLSIAVGLLLLGGLAWWLVQYLGEAEIEADAAKDNLVGDMSENFLSYLEKSLAAAGADVEKVKKIKDEAVAKGKHEEFEKLCKEHVDRIPDEDAAKAALLQFYLKYFQEVEEFDADMTRAEDALGRGDDDAELKHLKRAINGLGPVPKALEQLAKNPIRIRRRIVEAVAVLREQLAQKGEPLFATIDVTRDVTRLDLSSNSALTRIGALNGIPLTELDLAGTGVSDLKVLKGMPLHKLWLDDSKVANLKPVAALPLHTLTFPGTPVRDLTPLESMAQLKVLRHSASGPNKKPVIQLAGPEADGIWENALGLRLAPVPGRREVLCSTTAVRIRDFAAFVQSNPEAVESATNWKKARGKLGGRFSATRITRAEADAFCEWLTNRDREAGHIPDFARYRLPLDIEWSAVCGLSDHPFQTPSEREIEGLAVLGVLADSTTRLPAAHGSGFGAYRGLADSVKEWTGDVLSTTSDPAAVCVRGDLRVGIQDGEERSGADDTSGAQGVDLRNRRSVAASTRAQDLGFRIVLELGPGPKLETFSDLIDTGNIDTAIIRAQLLSSSLTDGERTADELHCLRAVKPLLNYHEIRQVIKRSREINDAPSELFLIHEGRRFLHINIPVKWKSAERMANNLGGRLGWIEDEAQLKFVEGAILSDSDPVPMSVWMGARLNIAGRSHSWTWAAESAGLLPEFQPTSRTSQLLLSPSGEQVIKKGENAEASSYRLRWVQRERDERHGFLITWDR